MLQPISNKTYISSNYGPMEKSIDLHNKLILNGFCDKDKNNKTRIEYLLSEINEFKQAKKENNYKNMEEEIGDVIFNSILLAHDHQIDPIKALENTNKKIDARIKLSQMYAQFPLTIFSFDERMKFWEKAKEQLKKEEHENKNIDRYF